MNITDEQHLRDKQFLIECLTADLARMLIEENGYSLEEALGTLYKSHTYEKLERASTGLYTQGAVYVMDHLKEELSETNRN